MFRSESPSGTIPAVQRTQIRCSTGNYRSIHHSLFPGTVEASINFKALATAFLIGFPRWLRSSSTASTGNLVYQIHRREHSQKMAGTHAASKSRHRILPALRITARRSAVDPFSSSVIPAQHAGRIPKYSTRSWHAGQSSSKRSGRSDLEEQMCAQVRPVNCDPCARERTLASATFQRHTSRRSHHDA